MVAIHDAFSDYKHITTTQHKNSLSNFKLIKILFKLMEICEVDGSNLKCDPSRYSFASLNQRDTVDE